MNLLNEKVTSVESELAQKRLLSIRGDPFLVADWDRVLFLHFAIAPEQLRPFIPSPLELDLYEGQALVSLVAVTMRRFRPARPNPFAWALSLIACQQFLNVRTYVRLRDEPGALFLWGWLSKPFHLALPTFDLPCAFANVDYNHDHESGKLSGQVNAAGDHFKYQASIDHPSDFVPCSPGSLAEFAMERYSGFFARRNRVMIFRASHPAWQQSEVNVSIDDKRLVTTKFDWFKEAKLVGANFAPGFKQVSLGGVHSLRTLEGQARRQGHGASAFYEMP
jgi:uncharacterized protein YqjF (DUF2071 family)